MRNLTSSESQIIRQILRKHGSGSAMRHSEVRVLNDGYVRVPDASLRFNVDFVLEFVDRQTMTDEIEVLIVPVLPQTTGVYLFLVVDKVSHAPLLLELQGGPELPITYFSDYIPQVDTAVDRALSRSKFLHESKPLPSIAAARYCRLIVICDRITFQVAHEKDFPHPADSKFELVATDDLHIDMYSDSSKLTWIDGWMVGSVPTRRSKEILSIGPE